MTGSPPSAACSWITQRSMIRTPEFPLPGSGFDHVRRYSDWRGAFRGEYNAATKRWDVYAPIWHGGQGVKALAYAARALGDAALLDDARFAADFLLRHQLRNPADPDDGLLLAFENANINTTAIIEALDGLLVLSEISGDPRYADAATAAARWALRKAWQPGNGKLWEEYQPDLRAFHPARTLADGRLKDGAPMLDDGVFTRLYTLTGDKTFLDASVDIANRLLSEEDPPGNFAKYPPNDPISRTCHPRTAYWWGRPMWMVTHATGDPRYLACARRAAEWYTNAMRLDGGLFRSTSPDFNTPSFDHATSGIACASILWLELAITFGDTHWDLPAARALRYCYAMQFTNASDENLHGAILEKVRAPAGSDAPPWYLRDLGTFFYTQSLARHLTERPSTLTLVPPTRAADGA